MSILAIFGEWTGKVRSTPSPCTMRRTVNISRMPSPRLLMTTPAKICTRSFSPSRMRWCTSTWSPMSNSATSFLSPGSSTRAISLFFMTFSFVLLTGFSLILFGPAAAGFGLLPPPFGDFRVIAAQQNLGHRHAAKFARPRILGILYATRLAMRFVLDALLVAEHAGHVADDGVDDDHGGHFAAVANEVADRNLARLQAQPDALVKTLIAPAQEDQPLVPGQVLHHILRQPLARRRQHHEQAGLGRLGLHLFDAREHRFGHQHHAGAATERPVVHALVLALRPVADVPHIDLDQAALERELQDALRQVALEDVREQGQHIASHRGIYNLQLTIDNFQWAAAVNVQLEIVNCKL